MIALLEVFLEACIRKMIQRLPKLLDASLHDDPFVHFHAAQLSAPAFEQPKDPVGSHSTETQACPKKIVVPADFISIRGMRFAEFGSYFLSQGRSHALIGVNGKQPISGRLIQGILFLSAETLQPALENPGVETTAKLDSGVGGMIVNNNDLISQSLQALEASSDVSGFVFGNDESA